MGDDGELACGRTCSCIDPSHDSVSAQSYATANLLARDLRLEASPGGECRWRDALSLCRHPGETVLAQLDEIGRHGDAASLSIPPMIIGTRSPRRPTCGVRWPQIRAWEAWRRTSSTTSTGALRWGTMFCSTSFLSSRSAHARFSGPWGHHVVNQPRQDPQNDLPSLVFTYQKGHCRPVSPYHGCCGADWWVRRILTNLRTRHC